MTISRRGFLGMSAAAGTLLSAQDGQRPIFRVKVDMVVLSFQVTDNKGHYVNGLKPGDFKIYEDGILQSVSTFAEGAKAAMSVEADGTTRPQHSHATSLTRDHAEAIRGLRKAGFFAVSCG